MGADEASVLAVSWVAARRPAASPSLCPGMSLARSSLFPTATKWYSALGFMLGKKKACAIKHRQATWRADSRTRVVMKPHWQDQPRPHRRPACQRVNDAHAVRGFSSLFSAHQRSTRQGGRMIAV